LQNPISAVAGGTEQPARFRIAPLPRVSRRQKQKTISLQCIHNAFVLKEARLCRVGNKPLYEKYPITPNEKDPIAIEPEEDIDELIGGPAGAFTGENTEQWNSLSFSL
jgi:hypothetical protein